MHMKRHWPGLLLLTLGAVFIGLGLFRSEHLTVLRKAITVCLECIGIG